MEKLKSHFFKRFLELVKLIANLAVIIGLIIAYCDFKSTDQREKKMEQRRYAVDAISNFNSYEFLKSTSIVNTDSAPKNADYMNAANYVFNSYYNLSVIYNNNLADNRIIAESMEKKLTDFVGSELYRKGFPEYNYDWDSLSRASIQKMHDDIIKNK